MNPYETPKSGPGDVPAITAGHTAVTCPHCGHAFHGKAKKTFLGFHKYTCAQCDKAFKYPLSPAYRVIYWVLLAGAFGMIASSPEGKPNIFTLLMSIAVLSDLYLLWRRR